MLYLLEVNNKKDNFLQELLSHFWFVKTRPLSKPNVNFVKELQKSVTQIKLAKKGKLKLQTAKDLLNEL